MSIWKNIMGGLRFNDPNIPQGEPGTSEYLASIMSQIKDRNVDWQSLTVVEACYNFNVESFSKTPLLLVDKRTGISIDSRTEGASPKARAMARLMSVDGPGPDRVNSPFKWRQRIAREYWSKGEVWVYPVMTSDNVPISFRIVNFERAIGNTVFFRFDLDPTIYDAPYTRLIHIKRETLASRSYDNRNSSIIRGAAPLKILDPSMGLTNQALKYVSDEFSGGIFARALLMTDKLNPSDKETAKDFAKRYFTWNNQKRKVPFVMPADTKVEQLGSGDIAEALRTIGMGERQIATAFQVPKILVNIDSPNNRSDMQDARIDHFEKALCPLFRQIEDSFNFFVLERDTSYRYRFDLSRFHSAMKTSSIIALRQSALLHPREARDQVGIFSDIDPNDIQPLRNGVTVNMGNTTEGNDGE